MFSGREAGVAGETWPRDVSLKIRFQSASWENKSFDSSPSGCAIFPHIMMRRQTDRKVRRPFYLNDAAAFVRSAASTAKLI